MKKVLIIFIFSVLSSGLFAQDFEVPKNCVMSTSEDFAKYEPDVLKAINWLLNTPLAEQSAKQKEVNGFVIQWLTGTTVVSVEVKTEIVNFIDSNPQYLMIFMCGWTKYALESKDFKNKVTGNIKGIEAVIDFYTKNREAVKKEKNIEKYIKMKENGKLEEFIAKQV
jgi:hypothetical protein